MDANIYNGSNTASETIGNSWGAYYTTQGIGGTIQGISGTYPISYNFSYGTTTTTGGPVEAIAKEKTVAVEIIYRRGMERVQTQVIKGVMDTEDAEELFRSQLSEDDEKEVSVIAAIGVLV